MPNHNRLSLPSLPLLELQTVPGKGHYVTIDGRPWARYQAYGHATQCCASLTGRQIKKLAA